MPSGKRRVHFISARHNADGMNPAFSGKHPKLFLISDLYRYLPTSHGSCRSALDPCYVNLVHSYMAMSRMVDLDNPIRRWVMHHLVAFVSQML